jgi:2-hydroxy-6-oxo-6-(2'-aminophenyl)hexa-2,4-dienoate hydrolase
MNAAADYGNFVEANGIRTHYLEQGRGEPVVLIHGGGAGADSMGNWRYVMPVLARHYRVIAMDMVGFGMSAKPNGAFVYSQEARNRHLLGFLDAMGLDRAVLVGNSMGGATALGVAVEHPARVRKLVMMGSAGLNTEIHADLRPVVEYDFTREGMVRLIRALTTASFQIDEALVTYRHSLSVEPATRDAYKATMGWIRQMGGLYYDEDFIRRNVVPTLVVNGKDDKVVPLRNAHRFLELIENSWGYIIPHCGHWAMIETPDTFAAATRSFVEL